MTMTPIHTNHLDEAALYKERLSIALKAAKICVFEVDLSRQLYTSFENAEDIFGVAEETILKDIQPYSTLPPEEYRLVVSNYFSHPEDEATIAEAFTRILGGQPATYIARMRAAGSKFIWCKIDVTPILKDNQPVRMIGVITDISDSKRTNDRLKEQILLDTFTGLYNKQAAFTLINKQFSEQSGGSHALILLDMDNFKCYNDTYGHYEGDHAIRRLADCIKETFRSSDILGRFGGDEFILLIKDFPDTAWLCEKIRPIIKGLDCELPLTTSAGIAIYPQDGTTFEDLFQKADKALYHSKKEKSAFTFFSEIE